MVEVNCSYNYSVGFCYKMIWTHVVELLQSTSNFSFLAPGATALQKEKKRKKYTTKKQIKWMSFTKALGENSHLNTCHVETHKLINPIVYGFNISLFTRTKSSEKKILNFEQCCKKNKSPSRLLSPYADILVPGKDFPLHSPDWAMQNASWAISKTQIKTRKTGVTFQVYISGNFRITYPEITDFDRIYLL